MNDSQITIDGLPLEAVQAVEKNIEIARHLRDEVTKLGVQCGLRRCTSKPSRHLGHSGRPKKAISLYLLKELEPFLRDDSYSLAGIADLFDFSMGELQFYMRRLGLHRKRGNLQRRAA
jgi:hypothetical protein